MIVKLFTFWFKWKGWKIEGNIPYGLKKGVVIGAPHTSNWDFVYALAALHLMGIQLNYLAKKQLFRWPLSLLLRRTGGIAVDRSKNHNLVEAITRLFSEHDKLIMLFPAEGTRSPVSKWKTGFYYVALQAKVPVYMAYLDYEKRTAGIGAELHVTGDIEKDFSLIREFYSTKSPRIEKNFNREGIKPH